MSHERPSLTAKKIARFLILIDAVPRFAGLLPAEASTTAEAILRASGAVRQREIRASLRLVGKRMQWGIRPRHLPGFVEEAGYRVVEQVDGEMLSKKVLAPMGLPEEPVTPYEYLALVEVRA